MGFLSILSVGGQEFLDWELKKELKDQLAREEGYYRYAAGTRERFALVYPNSYFVGMSNLGLHIIYEIGRAHV